MIIPFERLWLRNGWFVAALVVTAVVLWMDAYRQIQRIRFDADIRVRIAELEKACDQIKKP